MKYGIPGSFIKLAFAKTAFAYMEKAIPELDMAAYKMRVLKEYRAIVERTPGIGSMKDNMFVLTMYCGAFAIALYKMADGKLDEEKLKGLIRALAYCPLMVKAKQGGQERLYGKGDRKPHPAGRVVAGAYRGIPDELVLLL